MERPLTWRFLNVTIVCMSDSYIYMEYIEDGSESSTNM